MCLNPRIIQNRKYQPSKKNNGVVPVASDYRLKGVSIPCGECAECCREKRNEWKQRLNEEAYTNEAGYGYFVTLSISEESMDALIADKQIDDAEVIAGLAIRRFNERWRQKFKKSIKHWMVPELGSKNTERLHLHGIVWVNKEQAMEVKKMWGYGNIWIEKARGEVTAGYVVKYLTKPDRKHPGFRSRIYCSPGIGAGYLTSKRAEQGAFKGRETDTRYRGRDGKMKKACRYYRRRLYTEEQLEEIRLATMEREVWYVAGKKMRGQKTSEENMRLTLAILQEARRMSIRDGYIRGRKMRYTTRGGKILRPKDSLKEWGNEAVT